MESRVNMWRFDCEYYDWLTCVLKPARRALRRQIDDDASSVNAPLNGGIGRRAFMIWVKLNTLILVVVASVYVLLLT